MPHVCGTPLYRIKPTMFWHFSRGRLHMSQIWFVNPIGGEAYSSRMGLKPLRRQNTRRFSQCWIKITFRDMVFKVLWRQQACNLGRKKDWFFVLLFLEPYGNRLKLFKVIPLNHLNTQFWTAQGYPAVVRGYVTLLRFVRVILAHEKLTPVAFRSAPPGVMGDRLCTFWALRTHAAHDHAVDGCSHAHGNTGQPLWQLRSLEYAPAASHVAAKRHAPQQLPASSSSPPSQRTALSMIAISFSGEVDDGRFGWLSKMPGVLFPFEPDGFSDCACFQRHVLGLQLLDLGLQLLDLGLVRLWLTVIRLHLTVEVGQVMIHLVLVVVGRIVGWIIGSLVASKCRLQIFDLCGIGVSLLLVVVGLELPLISVG